MLLLLFPDVKPKSSHNRIKFCLWLNFVPDADPPFVDVLTCFTSHDYPVSVLSTPSLFYVLISCNCPTHIECNGSSESGCCIINCWQITPVDDKDDDDEEFFLSGKEAVGGEQQDMFIDRRHANSCQSLSLSLSPSEK